MSKKKIIILLFLSLFAVVGFLAFKFFSTTNSANTKISGRYLGNQVWSGEITITGDTEILGNLTVLPGTVVKFAVGDDQNLKATPLPTLLFLSCKS